MVGSVEFLLKLRKTHDSNFCHPLKFNRCDVVTTFMGNPSHSPPVSPRPCHLLRGLSLLPGEAWHVFLAHQAPRNDTNQRRVLDLRH